MRSLRISSVSLRLIGRGLVSLIILTVLLLKLDFQAVLRAVKHVSAGVLAIAFVATGIGIWLDALRWWMLQHSLSLGLCFKRVWSMTLVGMFFNVILPGNTGGDFIKLATGVRERPHRKLSITLSVLLDRYFGLTAIVVLAFAATLADFGNIRHAIPNFAAPLLLALTLVGATLIGAPALAAFLPQRLLSAVVCYSTKLPFATQSRMIGGDLLTAFRSPWSIGSSLVALMVPLVTFSSGWLVARSIGINIGYTMMLVIMPIAFIASCLPISFGGLGVREGAFTILFTSFSVTTLEALKTPREFQEIGEAAVAFSLLYYAIGLTWSLIGGAVYFSFRGSDSTLLRNNR